MLPCDTTAAVGRPCSSRTRSGTIVSATRAENWERCVSSVRPGAREGGTYGCLGAAPLAAEERVAVDFTC
jgi:hypothetical protein